MDSVWPRIGTSRHLCSALSNRVVLSSNLRWPTWAEEGMGASLIRHFLCKNRRCGYTSSGQDTPRPVNYTAGKLV